MTQSLVIETIQSNGALPTFSIYKLNKISTNDKKILYERNFIQESRTEKYVVVLSDDQNCYIILGGQDHIELVTLQSGFRLDEVYITGKKIVAEIESHSGFAYNQELGYLGADPNHLGSGIKS